MTFEVPIDSGLSRHYDPANGLSLDKPLRGGDRSAPEHQDCKTLCNPFPTDVYYLGSFVRGVLFEGFGFMEPLVADMVQDDPTKCPKTDRVVTHFREIEGKLSTWKLRSRIDRRDEIWPISVWRSIGHWYRTIGYGS